MAVQAQVTGQEYLGADVVLRCQVGHETLTVRAPGSLLPEIGQQVPLHWRRADMHFFDTHGQRMAA